MTDDIGTLLQTLEEAIADAGEWKERARTAERQREWFPIDTAPKDGTRILLMDVKDPKFKLIPDILWIKVGIWRAHHLDGYEEGWREAAVAAGADTSVYRLTPSHWQPLPTLAARKAKP